MTTHTPGPWAVTPDGTSSATSIEKIFPEGAVYQLPENFTWDRVNAERARWDIRPTFVPLAAVSGVAVAWGTPFYTLAATDTATVRS